MLCAVFLTGGWRPPARWGGLSDSELSADDLRFRRLSVGSGEECAVEAGLAGYGGCGMVSERRCAARIDGRDG